MGIPSGVGALRLQPTRLRVWLCRPSSVHPKDRWASQGNAWTTSDAVVRQVPCWRRIADGGYWNPRSTPWSRAA